MKLMRRRCCRSIDKLHILKALDLNQKLTKKKYEQELEK